MNLLNLKEYQLPFNLDISLSCGQIFLWDKDSKGIWNGIHKGEKILLKQEENIIFYDGIKIDDLIQFLALDINLQNILFDIRSHVAEYNKGNIDLFLEEALLKSDGLRILRQDPWECLLSFICASNSNLKTIGRRIRLLSDLYGREIEPGYRSYPLINFLTQAGDEGLRSCCTGYRASYIKKTADFLDINPDYLISIDNMDYIDAKRALLKLSGVGPKVADCVLLFSYTRYEAVPVDTRIRKIIALKYLKRRDPGNEDGSYSYNEIAYFCKDYFGPYAGYAQQYLYNF